MGRLIQEMGGNVVIGRFIYGAVFDGSRSYGNTFEFLSANSAAIYSNSRGTSTQLNAAPYLGSPLR